MKNFIVRTITSVFFVAAIVSCFVRPEAMIFLFALVTGMTIWEFTGLVNDRNRVVVNQMISTVAGVYFFLAMAGFCSGITPPSIFVPYLVTLIYRSAVLASERAGVPVRCLRYPLCMVYSLVCVRVPLDQRRRSLYLRFALG